MKKRMIVLIILLMSIGFAAIATNLFINGQTAIAPNQADFDIYFSDAYVNNLKDLSVITSDRVIEFTTTFEKLGQKYILDYEVTNGSKNYDAELIMSCTSSSEYLTVTNEFDDENILLARDYRLGKLTIEQTKSNAGEDLEASIECIIDANAVERDTLNEEELQTNATYVIEGYYKDESNNSIANANLVIFSDTPHYVTTDESGYLFYNGLERGNHEVYYVNDTLANIKNMTKEEIISNAKASSEFTTKTLDSIELSDKSHITNLEIASEYSYCEKLINREWNFEYTGTEQKFLTRCNGEYKVELWGASGGTGYSTYLTTGYSYGGKGAYVSGNITLNKNKQLYFNIGGQGASTRTDKAYLGLIAGGYNGGGTGRTHNNGNSYVHNGAGGGGATHLALSSGTLDSFDSNVSSILMVAAGGGGGGGHQGADTGGYAGGLVGGNGFREAWEQSYGGTQTSGGVANNYNVQAEHYAQNGSFGKGGDCANAYGGGGGGAGLYGGGGGSWNSGAGGSSYIVSINNEYKFTNTMMIDGEGYIWTTQRGSYKGMPNHDNTLTMVGNAGNGYARITLISIK